MADALRTEQVTIAPSLLDLFSGAIRVRSISIERPYLSALRTRNGKLRMVPTLLDRPITKGAGGAPVSVPPVHIAKMALRDGVVELFDATVAQPQLKIRLERLQASVRDVRLSALTGQSEFDLSGVLKGVRQDVRITVGGLFGGTKEK